MHAFSLRLGPAAASLLLGGLLLAFPGAASRGAAGGLALCLNTAVPSLFPFMVLAVYVSASGAGEDLGRLLRRPVQWLGLPAQTASAVLLAFLGGYPVGAAGISQLLREEKLTRPQAQRVMALCCLPSPAFMVAAVGNNLLHSPRAGAVLWACTALGATLPLLFTRKGADLSPTPAEKPQPRPGALFFAVERAAKNTLSLCAFIVVFCTLQALLEETPLPAVLAEFLGAILPAGAAKSLLPVLLEVTTGAAACTENGAPLWLFAFGAGWGGLCVQGQAGSFFRPGELKKGAFLRARLVHGLVSAGLCGAFFRLFPGYLPAVPTFATHTVTDARAFSAAAPASAAILVLCGVFCLTAGQKNTPHRLFGR